MDPRTRRWIVWGGIALLGAVLVAGNLLFGAKPRYPAPGPLPRFNASPVSSTNGVTAALVPAGVKLGPVTRPPADTIGGVDPKSGAAGSVWGVVFGLYGLGPVRSGSSTVLARISSATARPGASPRLSPQGRNVLLIVPAKRDTAVMSSGGDYSGTVTLELLDSALRFVVRDVRKR